MISYDIYKNRIRKLAAVKNFIVRFRVLFLAVLALIVGLISAFLISKGMITGELVLPEGIVYGEKYEVEPGKALFSAARVEYAYLGRKEGGAQSLSAHRTSKEEYVWTSDLPTLAGEYLARTVTDKAFGKGYGKPVRFEIQTRPVEFVINSDSVIYGSNPGEYTFPLANGDTLQVEGLSFDFESFETDLTNVCANAQSFVILNTAGEDVTFCYDISTPQKEITIQNKAVTLAPAVTDFVYDGSPVVLETIVDGLTQTALGGDRAQIVTVIKDEKGNALTEFPVATGSYTVEIDPEHTAIFHGETDVTARYDLSYRTASFTIARRTVEIATASATKEYDGASLSNADFSAEGLAEGHKLVAVSALPELTNAGVLTNEYAFRVEDGDGNDVTEHYAPSYKYGTLEVTRRAVVLQSASAEKVYDGSPLVQTENYAVITESDASGVPPYGNPLVSGHAIAVTGGASITYVNESGAPNALVFTVKDEHGNDVTANYAFEYAWGTLTVLKRTVTVKTATLTKEYDGTPLKGTEEQETENGKTLFTELAGGDIPRAVTVASITNVFVVEKERATIPNDTVYGFYTTREGFERDVTENYEITYENGTLEITPRPIAIYTPSESWIYDGKDHINAEECDIRYAPDETVFGFVSENHVPVITKIASIRNVGTAENVWEILIGERVDDPDAKYDFLDSNLNKYVDMTPNYEFAKWEYGTLEITRRPITIVTPTASRVFDGSPFSETEQWKAEGYGLPEGHTLRVKEKTEIPSVTYVTEGEVQNEITYTVHDGAGTDVTVNYEIGYVYGKIWRTQRPITIVTGNMHTEYDGLPLQNPTAASYKGEDFGLVAGHEIVLDESKTIASVTYVTEGEVENELHYFVYEGETDRSENYEISYDYGVIYRTARKITVMTSTFEKIYDGALLWGNAHPETGSDEAYADRLAQGENFRDELRAVSGRVAYALDAVWNPTAWDDDFVWNDDFIWTDFYELGCVPNRTQYAVYDLLGEDRTENYEITYEYGTLTITPKTVRVQTPDASQPYNGIPLSNTEITLDSLADGETCLVRSFSSILDFGKIENSITLMVQRPSSDPIFGDYITDDTTRNYTFEYTYGTLEITKCDLTVHTATLSKIYDGAELRSNAEPDGETIFGTAAWFEGLVSVDSCESDEEHVFAIVQAGSATNTTEYRVYADRNDEKTDITENYRITYEKGELQILPRPITVLTETATKEYDGDPFTATEGWKIVSALGLVGGHKLAVKTGSTPASVTNVKGSGLAEEGEQNTVEYEVVDPAVTTPDGAEKVSHNYTVTYQYGYINRTPRLVRVTTTDDSRVYDGTEWSNAQYRAAHITESGEEDGLTAFVLGHTLKTLTDTKILNVGTADNSCTYDVVDVNGDSVAYNYKLDYRYGKLEVTRRPLKITTASHDTVYNGLPMEYRVAVAEKFNEAAKRGILAGHNIVLDESKKIASVTYVTEGRIQNELHYLVKDGETDLTKNYEIEYEYGEIWRTKREITIRTGTYEKEFDGEYLYGDGDRTDFGNRADGDYPKADFVASMREVFVKDGAPATIENNTTYKLYTAREGAEREVTENYEITYENGTLKITPRKIEVESPDGEWVYDGKEHTTQGYEVRHVTETGTDNDDLSAYGHKEYTVKNTVIRNAGTATNEFEIRIVEVAPEGGEYDWELNGIAYCDVTYNYEIVNKIYGTLEITKRPITLTVQKQEKFYDGLSLPENPKVILWGPVGDPDAGFAEGQLIDQDSIVCKGSQTEAGESELVLTACKIGVFNGFTKIEDTTENYEITFVAGKLIVNKRPITVTAQDQSKVYDGQPLPVDPDYRITTSVSDGSLLGKTGQRAESVSFAGSQTNAGSSPLTVSDFKIVIDGESGETDVTKNYEITYENGTLTVTRRPLLITTESHDTVYDGAPMEHRVASAERFHESAQRGIVAGHEIVLDESKTIASVTYVTDGRITNELHYLVKDGETDLTGNYEIKYEYGEIWRTLRPLDYTTEGDTKEYDGAPLRKAGVTCSENGLASTDRASEITAPEITNVGTQTNDIAVRIEHKNGGKDVTENYAITHTFGTLTVTPRVIEVTTNSNEFEYDGTAHYDASASKIYHVASGGAEKGLVLKHALKATEWTELTDAGEEENVCVYTVVDPTEPERDISRNYSVTVVGYGKLKVIPRKIVVVTGSTQFIYDGDPHSYTEEINAKKAESAEKGLVLDHKLVADPTQPIFAATDVRDTKAENNKFVCIVQDGAGKDIGKNYEIVRYEYGTIEILPRPIVIHSPGDEKEYDGDPLKNDAYTVDNLVTKLNHKLVAQNDPVEIVNVGERDNANVFKIFAGTTDVTENYAPSYDFGKLKVTPRKLMVLPKALENLVYGDSFGGYENGKNNFVYGEGSKRTVSGEELRVSVYYTTDEAGNNRTATVKDSGVYYVWIELNAYTAYKNGAEVAEKNYVLEQTETVSFEILKKELRIKLHEQEGKIYDGTVYTFPADGFDFTESTGTAYGEKLTLGILYFNETLGAYTQALNAGSYTIGIDPNACRIDGSVSATRNYKIVASTVKYVIKPRPFSVALQNEENREYNAQPYDYSKEGHVFVCEGLLSGDRFDGETFCLDEHGAEAVFAGSYTVKLRETGWKIFGAQGEVTENYTLTESTDGVLNILPRQITVSVRFNGRDTYETEYTGLPVSVPQGSYESQSAGGFEGFVNGDELSATQVYTYRQNGAETEPIEPGRYAVSLRFTESELVAKNYDITYEDGVLEIVTRHVTVQPEIEGDLEYDGKPLDTARLSFRHWHKNYPNEEGFVDGDEQYYAPSYTVTDLTTNEKYDFEQPLQAGSYYLNVTLTIHSDFKGGYSIEYVTTYFYVSQRAIGATVSDFEKEYDKKAVDTEQLVFTDYYVSDHAQKGFVLNDAALAAPVYEFVKEGETFASAVNAGEYRIRVASFTSKDGFIERNYEIVELNEDGVLKITPRKLVVVPVRYSELFTSMNQVVALPRDRFELLYGALAEGDKLEVFGDNALRATEDFMTWVGIASVSITDRESGESTAQNYVAKFTYDESDPDVSKYNEMKFTAALTFGKRKMEIRQNVPPAGYSVVQYEGERVEIPFRGEGAELYTAVSYNDRTDQTVTRAEYGLLSGHRIVITDAYTDDRPGVTQKWIRSWEILDADGYDVTFFYSVTVNASDPATHITVQARELKVTAKGNPSDYAEGDVVEILALEGELFEDQKIEIKVVGGQFVATVFEEFEIGPDDIRRIDKTRYYTIEIIS